MKRTNKARNTLKSTKSIRTDNMKQFKPIYYFFSMKYGGLIIVVYYISVHAYIGC